MLKRGYIQSKGTLYLLGLTSGLIWMGSLYIWMQGNVENPWLGGVAWILAMVWMLDVIKTPLEWHLDPLWSKWVYFWVFLGLALIGKGIWDLQSAFTQLSLSQYDGYGWIDYTYGICLAGGGIWCIWKGWLLSFLTLNTQSRFFFPMWLFGLTLPWEAVVRHWNQPLQEKATDLAVMMLDGAYLLKWIDFKVEYWDSYTFYSDRFYLIINETCSGVNLLISMSLYALGFAWITHSNQRQSLWILLSTLSLCLFFNSLRIVMIFLLGHYGDRELAMGPWHEGSGYAVQLLFFICLAGLRFTLFKDPKDNKDNKDNKNHKDKIESTL
jgi:exosortase/archaeosortase family protein